MVLGSTVTQATTTTTSSRDIRHDVNNVTNEGPTGDYYEIGRASCRERV